ncbi:unnamed protein product [Parnassius apollo]|uniref:(apollo) hypothetical protein n=1 Tax=Parnassius apollo TaxID=110799 RepID=A0A8S3YCV0_PARAO|nr:unnamed protein product [Parnassius apollo]
MLKKGVETSNESESFTRSCSKSHTNNNSIDGVAKPAAIKMAAGRQIRLLLWKDYLVRKRNPITLAGVVWATAIISSLYIVRINVDNQDFPSCQFPARALPSAGVLTFLQSFMCSVNNECSPMDQFEEIPSYSNAKLTQLKRQFSPLFSNTSLLDTAVTVPDALKLLATLSDVADVPEFVYVAKNGLQVRELFRNPERVKRYLTTEMSLDEPVANSLFTSDLSFEGILQGNFNTCSPESIIKTIKINNVEHLNKFAQKMCSLSNEDFQKLFMDLLVELDLGKYIQMIGNMYFKLSNDERITELGKMAAAVLRMMSPQSFLPPEIIEIFQGETPDFSYIHLDVISNILDYFEPDFGDTQSYKSIRNFADSTVVVIQYLHRFSQRLKKSVGGVGKDFNVNTTMEGISNIFSNAIEVFDNFADNGTTIDAFNLMPQITNFIYKWLPDKTKHDVLFYSTLITKLIEGAEKVIYINVNIEELIYNVSLRHPQGVKVLRSLPTEFFAQGLEALADVERVQILTSKLDSPGEMFCDSKKLQKFFNVEKDIAVKLQTNLCTAAWKDYIADLIRTFGIYEVRNNINAMAALFIQEILGKDTTSQLYTLDRDFQVLKNFVHAVIKIDEVVPRAVNWSNIIDSNQDSKFMKIVRDKRNLGKQMLVTVHGALAKEVVKQNPILELKIAPFLTDATTIVSALSKEIDETPQDIAENLKTLYPTILRTILTTALDEEKTYKLLSTFSQDAVCRGVENASMYLIFPPDVHRDSVVTALCNINDIFENILKKDSHLGNAVSTIMSKEDQEFVGIEWTKLINDLKNLYVKMAQYYPYFLEYKTFGMDDKMQMEIGAMLKEVKTFWFGTKKMNRSIRLSIKLGLGVLDLVDREIFNLKGDTWLQLKYAFGLLSGPLSVMDDIVKLIQAISKNETLHFTSALPMSTIMSISKIIPYSAQLLQDEVDLIVKDETQIEPIIEIMNAVPAWPCSRTSLADLLTISDSSKEALKGLEYFMCLNKSLQEDWMSYLETKNIYKLDPGDLNSTVFEPHLFLRFSAAFDSLIEDTYILKDFLLDALNESADRHPTLLTAWKHAVNAFNTTDRDDIFRKVFSKMDTILNSIRVPSVKLGVPLIALWRNFWSCSSNGFIEDSCKEVGRAMWLHIFKFVSVTLSNVAEDLLTYFKEIHEPDSNLLQLMGFTKKTSLYLLYEKLPDFIGVLVNSYGDYGFMTQIRRASLSNFWDCEAVVNSLKPAPGSPIDETIIARVQPFVCPSFLYWISLPRGDNALLNVVAKPQYYFFTSLVDNLNSTFEDAFAKTVDIANFLTELSNNKTTVKQNINKDTVEEKLTKAVDIMLNYKINESSPSYRQFNEANNNLISSTVYLTRVITIINKVLSNIENTKINDVVSNIPEEEIKHLDADLSAIKRIFKRRPAEGIAVFFDAITNNLWEEDAEHTLLSTFQATCDRLKNNDSTKEILTNSDRVKRQLCAMKYNIFIPAYGINLENEFENAKISLVSLVNILQNKTKENVTDISQFLKTRPEVIKALIESTKYAYDLSVPVYLKYLHNNLQHHRVIISLLSGGNWWQEMRDLYNGPYAKNFFDNIEKSFDIAKDILTNLDKIHWVRLIRDINANSKEGFCEANTVMSEYLPDETGAITSFKQQFCLEDKVELFKELPPLKFASQMYDNNLKIDKYVNYTALNSDVSRIESEIQNVLNGPKSPQIPTWVTQERLTEFRTIAVGLLSKESLTKASFGLLENLVDAGTLLLNNSQCIFCSQLTTWFKQLNLQLYKKQEYDNLICHLHEMNLQEVYMSLKNDFHWDMAIKELISTRNYTTYELNKSLNEFLEQVKQNLLEDMTASTTKVSQCLAQNVTRNAFGNATLLAKVLTLTLKLIRAELPHLQEIDGIKDLKYLKDLQASVAYKLDVDVPLNNYFRKGFDFTKRLKDSVTKDYLVDAVANARVNLRTVQDLEPEGLLFKGSKHTWEDLCECCDCKQIVADIVGNLNESLVEIDLQQLQAEAFWRFKFISNILERIENLVGHIARLLGVVSKVDLEGLVQGRLVSMIDTAMQLIVDDTLNSIVYSIHGLMEDLTPLIKSESLQNSLHDLSQGLLALQEFKNSLLEDDLKVQVSEIFSDPEKLESDLSGLGINNTNFWSIAAPRIQVGSFHFKPIFASKRDVYRISNFVCEVDDMSKVIVPGNVDVVTLDDIYGAVIEQFCDLDDDRAKQVVPVLMRNLNFTFIINKVKHWLLTEVYAASNLTTSEGERVIESLPQMASLTPVMQNNIGSLSDLMANEPVLNYFKTDFSLDSIFAAGDFMADAGRMVCGKPFNTYVNRIFKSIIETKDLSSEADPEQLKVLPTDFCRSLYKQIISIDGGKIVWSFVKPLVMGKILYTPNTPAVERIIKMANETFAPMMKMVNLVRSFSRAFSSVKTLSEHRAGLTALQNLLTEPSTQELRKNLLGDMDIPDIDVESLFEKIGDVQDLGSILQKGSDLLECINLNRFKPVLDEQQLTNEAVKLMRVNEFSAGLVFMNNDTTVEVPLNVEYKIRMDIENTPTTNKLKTFLWVPGPEANFMQDMRYFRGFIQIQDIIDKAIIDISANTSNRLHKRETRHDNDLDWAVYTQQIPYPCYRKDFFQTSLYESQSLTVALFFSLLFTTSSIVRFIVSDKETGNTMLMSVMGVNLTYHTMSWFLTSFVELVITCGCIATVLCVGSVLPRTAPSLIFALFFIYGFSVLSFCYMMSKLFKSASFAAVCTGIAYLVSFMPIVIILSLETVLTSSLKFLVCLFMSSSFCYACLFITQYEAMGLGAQWSQLWDTTHDVSDLNIGLTATFVIFDGIVYILIGLLLDRFLGVKAFRNNVMNCEASDEKAGVSIINITKVYGSGSRAKLALNNVSIELHSGQITSLLGHNGAGKTTLIKILTGTLRPTQGQVVVRWAGGKGGEGGQCEAKLGACPQRDVLMRALTAREHVVLYAQLKSGRALHEVEDQVESILRILSLGSIADEPVARLSGGTRRRLCVALAFVAEPSLVVLDEPTAGVDPAARRDIWSMILKLRENRTILLTTHHLDEAELLSDQIVIMHKGQVHTTGSPIDIKRSLGTGYTLTVMYSERQRKLEGMQEIIEDGEICIEEKTKILLATVRNVIKNANLVNVNGFEVEINLPFFGPNGVDNDFLQLCSMLESNQTALGFSSFTMDCSSLEQVFFTICNQADAPQQAIDLGPLEEPSKSGSTSSLRDDRTPLVPREGPLVGTLWEQFFALLYVRYLHYIRNRWLLFMLIVLPSLFVILAMAFSTVRPPPNNEFALKLHRGLYENSTEFLVEHPSIYDNEISSEFAQQVMHTLQYDKLARNWTVQDNPTCKCGETKQECDFSRINTTELPEMMIFNDVNTLNEWLIASQEIYLNKRFGGFSSSIKNSTSNLVVWYNNKGHHAMPSYLNALNSAMLRTVSGHHTANITTYTHPLKISKEQINKDTVYQHIADAGITAMLLIAYSLVSAGAAIYLVTARCSQEKRLQLLAGVSPALYWTTALFWDMLIIFINMLITMMVLQAFHFPVFVTRNNLPAICVLIFLYGYGCAGVVHVAEKLFSQASLANMVLFCSNTFIGTSGLAILLILDIISESDVTDNARWVLHKVFLLCPQFVLGDGLLEIARNTIHFQVLSQFGMDTYRDPLYGDLIVYHYLALVLVGTVLFLLNLAIEYDCFEVILVKFRSGSIEPLSESELDPEVLDERRRVLASRTPLRLLTIGNINAGFVDTEEKGTIKKVVALESDVAQCERLGKAYPTMSGHRPAVRDLTLGIPPGQCTALLGQNGAGKSTTFAMLTGEIRPTSGRIYLNDRRVGPRDLCQGLISYCPQSDAIDPLLTVRETLKFYCILRGITKQREVIRRTIEMFDLTKYKDVRSGTLSGGNKRKLCTAIAFMGRTPLVLLDEPTSGMDPGSRWCVSRGVRLACSAGRGVLLSTHALDDARRLAARVALLQAGALHALAPLQRCLRRFGGGYVVVCRARGGSGGGARAAWARVRGRAPHAQLHALHAATLRFLLPAAATVDGKEITTKLSDVFRLTAELRGSCDIEDFTVNQSSLDQMFLNFAGSNRSRGTELEDVETTPPISRHQSYEDLNIVTAL